MPGRAIEVFPSAPVITPEKVGITCDARQCCVGSGRTPLGAGRIGLALNNLGSSLTTSRSATVLSQLGNSRPGTDLLNAIRERNAHRQHIVRCLRGSKRMVGQFLLPRSGTHLGIGTPTAGGKPCPLLGAPIIR